MPAWWVPSRWKGTRCVALSGFRTRLVWLFSSGWVAVLLRGEIVGRCGLVPHEAGVHATARPDASYGRGMRITTCLMVIGVMWAGAVSAEEVKLLEREGVDGGASGGAAVSGGHPALRAGPGAEKEENFGAGRQRRTRGGDEHSPQPVARAVPGEPPDKANGTSVILSPGGGNNTCNVGGEGVDIAARFNAWGSRALCTSKGPN